MADVIGSSELLEQDDRPVRVEVTRPVRDPSGEWSCEVRLVGSGETWPPIRGEDSMQALTLALEFLRQVLSQRPGLRLRDGDEFPYDAYFPRL